MVRSWGTFNHDALSLNLVADNRGAAIRLIDEVGFNE
jgi:iron(III) transport system substrate-binding protein